MTMYTSTKAALERSPRPCQGACSGEVLFESRKLQSRHRRYLTGLLTPRNIPTTKIVTQVGLVSHDSLRRMMCSLGCSVLVDVVMSVKNSYAYEDISI